MANLKRQPVSYRPFQGQAILADGLLAVERPGGEVLRSIASGLFGLADKFGAKADAEAIDAGTRAGEQAALDNIPKVSVTGGDEVGAANRSADDERQPVFANAPKSGTAMDAIGRAAARHGVPASVLAKIAQVESGMNPKAKNPRSSAGGLFQFIDSTAAQYGLADRFDPYQASDAAARLLRDNTAYLTRKLGRAPSAGELYLAHQQGAGGAAKLLSNPGAAAVSVVGNGAVKLNGGDPNMTAGQFAALWTRKFDGAAPQGVTLTGSASRRTPVQIEVSGGLKLTGSSSKYGKAFDEASSRAYAAALQDEMLTAGAQLYEKYKDDPTELAHAFEELRSRQLSDHVPAGIKLDYLRGYSRMEASYLARAQKGHEEKIDKADREDYQAKGEDYAEAVNKAEAGIDIEDPNSLTVLQGEAARYKDHIAEGAARGYIKPEDAREAQAAIDTQVQGAWYVGQAKGKTAAEIKSMRDELRQDYAAGDLQGVDGKGFDAIDRRLSQLERSRKAEETKALSTVSNTARTFAERVAAGEKIPAADIDAFRVAAAKTPEGTEIVKATEDVLTIGELLRSGPVKAAEDKAAQMRKAAGAAPNAREAAKLRVIDQIIGTARKNLASDPLGYAAKAGVITDPGLVTDAQTPADLAGLVTRRLDMADDVARHFSVAPKIFRPGEAAAIDKLVTQDPEAGAGLAAAVVVGAGDRAPQVLKEFGTAAPVIAAAGAIIASNGSQAAAEDAIAGAGKNPEGKPYGVKGQAVRRALGQDAVATGLAFQPDDGARVLQAAEWIARKRMYDQGLESDAPEVPEIYTRALNEAAGAVYDGDVQYGGFADYDPGFWQSSQKVVVPNDIRADRFADVIDALDDADLALKPKGGVEQIKSLWPVLTARGYAFVDFDADGQPVPIMGEDGKPFLLDLDPLAKTLASRVPGAFRGY
jgi:hypothetical protein